MPIDVTIQHVTPRKLAAVQRPVFVGGVAAAWKPALDQVWAFLRTQPGLHQGGHNVFLYQHPAKMTDPMIVDFGVEVTRSFPPTGEVHETHTPAGEAAVALHLGPYDQLRATHEAIHQWSKANQRPFAGHSWEIYDDWSDDPSKLKTTVVYLLA